MVHKCLHTCFLGIMQVFTAQHRLGNVRRVKILGTVFPYVTYEKSSHKWFFLRAVVSHKGNSYKIGSRHSTDVYRVSCQVSDLGFIRLLPRCCFVCPIMFGQEGVGQNGHITLEAKVETTN